MQALWCGDFLDAGKSRIFSRNSIRAGGVSIPSSSTALKATASSA
jgi:hypothetical protein